jgi:DNA-binding NarL/FixJ family response regulator
LKFSKRESEILEHLKRGLTNKDIANNLGISPNTVRDHLRRMMLRSGLRTRGALAALFFSNNEETVRLLSEATDRRSASVLTPTEN